jgi:hypothetical protein
LGVNGDYAHERHDGGKKEFFHSFQFNESPLMVNSQIALTVRAVSEIFVSGQWSVG